MYAKVAFIQKDDALSKPYSYTITEELSKELAPLDFVLVESARSVYGVGVYIGSEETVDDPSIVNKSVLLKLALPNYSEYLSQKV
jgi:hypothetical protein